MPFRFLEHTADVRVECHGGSFEELLESAAQALYAVALRSTQTRFDREQAISLEYDPSASEPGEALVRWLQEIIYLMEVKYFVGVLFNFHQADASGIRATLTGYTYLPEERAAEVKAATYHGLDVTLENGIYRAELILDL